MDQRNPSQDKKSRPKFSLFFYNPVTYAGVCLTLLIFFAECFLFGVDFINPYSNVYLGLFTYTVLPPFLILGIALIFTGALRKRDRVRKGLAEARPKPVLFDPLNPQHRNAILVFVVGGTVLVAMTAIGSYKAFHYTESVQFCGVTCHKVMSPEYTRYQQSPHARVKCVECHIGPGVDWYVRSKLSGVRQVFKTVQNTFPRPILSPVHNLRPAKETCEHCHWPQKFYSSVEMRRHYFLSEGDNPAWFIRMLMQVGSEDKRNTGIHAHMYMDNDIYYVADDEKRQKISWVKTVDAQGKETVYTTPDSPYLEKNPPEELVRKMDCIDCHNRPTHRFPAPYGLINEAMFSERIDPGLPSIKEKGLELLSAKYSSREEALEAIRQKLTAFYQEQFGDQYPANQARVEQAVGEIGRLYKDYFFPEMRARWDAYPDNIGHLISPGCFRCHGGQHTASDGKTISRDCTVCHTIIEQGPPGALEKSTDGLPFQHPVDIGDMWQEMNCYECHTGGSY
ncbi:MAG: NapC/NirT family cytochrome c [Candidatus Omnitrophica bacterium]|nr:NapC/NirT family cytochrome c [Candidatus Omnitrophota bacterium]